MNEKMPLNKKRNTDVVAKIPAFSHVVAQLPQK